MLHAGNCRLKILILPAQTIAHRLLNKVLHYATTMITDVQLAIFSNLLGVSLFALIVAYHYVAANYPLTSQK